jgi:hypothetical protein
MEKQILELLKNKKNRIAIIPINNLNQENFLQYFELKDETLIMYIDEDANVVVNSSYLGKILPYKQFIETNELLELDISGYPFDYSVIGIIDENDKILALTCKIKETSKFFNPELLLIEDESFCKAVADFKNLYESSCVLNNLKIVENEKVEDVLAYYVLENHFYDDCSEFILNREIYNIPAELKQLFAGNVNVNVILIMVSEPKINNVFKLKSEDLVILESAYAERSIGHYSDYENRDDYAEKIQFAYVAIIIHHSSSFNVKCVASTSELTKNNVYWDFENVKNIDENFLKRTIDILSHSQSALVPSEYDNNDEESSNNFDVTDENRSLNYYTVDNLYGDIRDAYQYEQLNEWFKGIEE